MKNLQSYYDEALSLRKARDRDSTFYWKKIALQQKIWDQEAVLRVAEHLELAEVFDYARVEYANQGGFRLLLDLPEYGEIGITGGWAEGKITDVTFEVTRPEGSYNSARDFGAALLLARSFRERPRDALAPESSSVELVP